MTPAEWLGLGAGVFAAAAAYDWANAHYVVAANERLPFQAGAWSAVVASIGLVGLLGVLRISTWLALPEVAGYFVGTYGAVRQKKAR